MSKNIGVLIATITRETNMGQLKEQVHGSKKN